MSLNPVVELRRLFEGLPGPVRRPIELVVFGGDLPRADVSRMRWMAAELRAKADAMNEHAEDAGNILAQEDSLGTLGDRVRETLHLHQEGAAKLREEALALADQAHAAANDAEKTLCVMFAFGVELAWRIISTLAAAAAAGPAGQVAAAPVVESMLIEGRGRVALMRAGLEQAYKAGAAKTATRIAALGPHRFVLAVGTAAALPAGVDLGVQIAQVESGDRTATVKGPNGENPRGIDLKSVEAAAVSGAGGAVGGIAAGKVAPKLLPRLETSRSALGLVQGVAGAVSGLGAAALVTGWPEHFEDVLASLLSGGFGGVVDVHRGVHPDLGSSLAEVVDGGGAYVPPDPSTVSLSKDAVLGLAGAPQGVKSLTPAPPAGPVDSTTPQLATSAVPGHATDAGGSEPGRNLVSSGPPEATGDRRHQPDEAGDLAQRLGDSESGEQAPAPDDRTNSRAGADGQPGEHHSTARPSDRGSADHADDREPGVDLPSGGEETSGGGARAGADVPGGSGAAQTGDPAQADDDGHDDGARAHGGAGHDGGGAQAADVGNAQTGDGEHAGSGGGVQAGDGRGGGGAHGADGGADAHAGGPGAGGAQAAGGVASGAVSSGAGGDHSGSGPRQSAAHGGDHARAVGGGRSARAPVGDGMAGHEPAAVRPGRGPGKLDPPVQVGNASGRHGAGHEGLARVTAPKYADVPPVHEPPAVEPSKDAVPADVRPSVHDGPDRPAAELVAELAGLPSADPATKQDLSAEQQTQFKGAAKKALALYRLRHEELAAESWEQRRHAMEHGDRAESLLRYIDAMREGTGKTPRWNQIKAFLLGEHGFMRQMGTGQGKSMVGALDTLRQLSRGEPVEQASGKPVRVHHVITTTEVLANEGVREFAPMLRSLGYEVARWDPHNPPGETERPTVYYMTYDERATAELFDRPPPGKTATIDEADAVLVHNQTVHYQSDGQRELASEVEAAAVYRVRDFLKAVLRSRITTAEDLSAHLGEALHDGPLSVAEGGAARPLSAEEVGAARTLTARLLREQPERCLDTVSGLWESHAGRAFTAEETEMARAFLDVRAGRLKLNRDFQIFGRDAEKKIQILDEYGKPRSDPKIGTESRWFGGRHKMVEAMFGAPVYSDGTGSKQVTVEDVLGGYEHLHLMSGTLERTAAEIKENFPVEGGLAKVEDFGRSKLAGEQDRIFLTEPEKLRDAVSRVQQLQAEGRPVLVICPFNDLARKFSLMLTKADVEHTAIDARWFAEHRDNNAAEEHLLSVKDTAGVRGAVTVGTGMLGRGFDVSISDEVDRLGGVHAHMLGRSPTNPDEDHQWSARAGRNGRNGSFCFNVAASDRLYSDAQQHGARVAVTHYRTALAEHAEATAEYTEAVRRTGSTDAARPGEAVQAARTKVAATAADVAAAEREMRSLTSTLQNDAADRMYLERAMRRANQAHAPPTAVAPAAPSFQTTVAPGPLHTESGTVHTSADTGQAGADTRQSRSDTGHAGADIDRTAMEALHAGPDAVQPHLRGDRFARLAGWLGIPASVQAAAAVFDNDDADDPLSRLLERAGVSSAAVEALNQHLDHAPPAAVLRADALTDEQALNRLTPQRNRLAAELGWESAQVAGAEGVRQVGAAVDTARAELAVLLEVPVTEVNAATARDVLADAVARLLARTEIADDPATELLVLTASTYLAVTALLDLAVAIHQRSPKSCVNNGVTMMRVLYPDNEHAYHLPDDMPLRGHDAEATERAFGGAFRAFRSLDEAAESLEGRPWGSQALVYKWMNKGEVESHLVLLVNASDRAEAPNLVVLDIAAAPGQAPITAADLAARPALLKKAVPFQQWRREQQAFIDRLTEADRRVFAIEFDHKGEPLDRLSATRRSAVASQDPGLPPPSLWSSRAPPLRRNQFALAGHRPVGDGSLPGNSVRADTSQPDTAPSNVRTGRARPHDEPGSRGTGADSIGHSGEDGDGEPHIADEGSIGGRSSDAMSFLPAGDLPAEQMTGPVVVPQQLLLTEELAVALSDALTERDQAVHRITDQVREVEHALAPLVGEPGTVDMVSLMGVRDELSAFLGRQLAAYAETAEGQRDQMIATLREITARPRLDERDIRVLAEMVPVKRNKIIASLPGGRDRYAQELRTAARVRLAELDSPRAEFFRADDAIRRLQRGIQGRLDRAAEVLYDRGSRRTVRALLDGIDAMRSEISAARRQISVDWHDIPENELAPLLSEITRGLRSREDAVEAVAAMAAPRHITMVVDDALRTVEKSAVSIFAESSIRGFVFRDHDARNVRALEDAIARVRTMVRAPETTPDLSTRVVDESVERRSDFSTFVDPADTLYLHFTPNIRAIATTGMIRSGAHDDVVNTTAAHSVGVHFIKPGDWQGTENFNMYVGYAGLRRTLSGTVLPDALGAIVVMPLGAITETTPLRNEAKTTASDEAHLASDATFRPLNGSPRYAYPLDDAYIIPCYSDLQVSREQRLIIDPDTGERHWRPVAEPIRDAFRRAGYDEAWIDRHVIELPERIAADPETRASRGEYDRTQRLIRQAQEEIKRRMAEDGKYSDRLVVPLSTEHGRQLETLDRHGTTRHGYYSTLDFAIERLIVADRHPPETAPPAGRATVPEEQPPAKVAGQSSGGDAEQRARPRGPDGLIGRRPSFDSEGGAERRTAEAGTPGSDGPIDAGELGRLLAEHGVVVGRAAAARVWGSDVPGDPDVVELSVPEWLYRRCAAEGWAQEDGQRSVLGRGRFRVSVGWPGVRTDVVSHEDLAGRSWQPAEGGSKVALPADPEIRRGIRLAAEGLFEEAGDAGLTRPSRDPDSDAVPFGPDAAVPVLGPGPVPPGLRHAQRGLQRQNEAAVVLARAGFRVEQHPVESGARLPDFRIEGRIFDCYSPTTGKVSNICFEIRRKVYVKRQADRIVVNLTDSAADPVELSLALRRHLIPNLREVLAIDRRGTVLRLSPGPLAVVASLPDTGDHGFIGSRPRERAGESDAASRADARRVTVEGDSPPGLIGSRPGEQPDPLDASRGAWLKALRLEQGMKQKDVAQAAGLTNAALSNIEKGRRTTLGTFQQVCRALGVEGEALVAAARRFYPDIDLETDVAAHDSLGGWVAAHRNIRGMTKADLARAVGVTPTRIWEVENGDRPPANLFFRIARALDVGEQALAAAARSFYPEFVLDLDPAAHDSASTGTWIMALRHSRNMTQAELARTAGTSAGYIAGIEGGEYTPNSIIFRRICRALEVVPTLLGAATRHFYPELELDLSPRTHNPASPGGWIVAVRHDRDMTRLQLAEAIGPGWGHLGHIETGEYVPRFAVFRRICEVLGIDDELLRAATRQFYPHIDLDLEPAAHDLGGWITALRNDRDMTRVELARVTGLSTKYLAQVETENRRPQFGTFRRICRGLGVSGRLLIQAVRDFYPDITADIDPAAHQSLGRWIAALRYDEGMTTTELARRVGMPRRSLSDIENDRYLPRLSKLRQLCQAQGVGGELLLEIVERFYADRYERSGYRDEEELFQRYVVTRVGSPAEREVKDEINQRFAWIPKAVARREDPAVRDEVEQVAWIGMLLAIGNHVPSASFAAHAWASCRGAILRYRLAIRFPDLDDRILRLDAPISDDRSGHSVVADSAPVRSSDTGFVRKVRAALADMDDAATAERLVMLHLVEGMSFTRATQLLGLPADVAADVRAETVARLRRAFTRRQPSVRTASEQNRPTPWTSAGAEPDQPPIPPGSRGDSAPGDGRTRPGEFIGSRPGDDAPVAPGEPGRAGADPTADLIGPVDERAGLPTYTPPRSTPGSGSLGDSRPSGVPEATVADPSPRAEPAGPDSIHATGEELAHWATQLSDHGLLTFLTRAQTEASAHIAHLRRGQSPALEAAIAAARVQTALVVEQLHRSAAGGSGSLLAAADAATNVFEVIGALHSADTRSASYIHDLDVLTRFPERRRAAAELGATRFVDGSNWARIADEYLVAGRDNGWDQELIESLRVLPAQAAEFTTALTGSDRTFGEAAGRYIPNAYRAAMYYMTRSHDTDQAIARLRGLDHAVAAAVDRLGSTRAATDVGLSLLQLRMDIHAAIASADGAIAPAMRSSAMQGLDHNPQLPQMIERIVLDLRALARHGSETPRPIRPTYTAHPIAVQDVLGAHDEETSPVLAAEAFAVQDGTFIRWTGRSSELLQTGSDGVSFAMDQWGRLLAAATHDSLLHLISAMGEGLAGWGALFTDDDGRLDGPVRPYRLEKALDPMGTAQLRDALTRGGLRLDDANFDNEGQGKLWRRDAPPVSALFTMEPLGVLGSIESMFAVYDDGFWIKPVRDGTTRSADEVRVPLILGPLRHEPGNIEVAVYRQGDRTMVRYRDPDPGPEPDRVAPVFAEFHQRMNRWVAESDGAEWHPDTAQVVHTFEQHLERSAPEQDRPDDYIGSRPPDSVPEPVGRQPFEEDLAVRDERSMPDPAHATHQELTGWTGQLSDGELHRFLAEKQAEASAHVAAVHRGRPPAVDVAIGTARAQIALVAERWRRLTDSSTRPSSADAQTTADAATAVFHIIGALPMAATSPSAFTDDPDGLFDLLTRFPERLLTAAERDQATGADAEDWARRADAFLTGHRGGDWDSELIRSLRSLPAKAAEFAHALTGSDRDFGAAATQYIPDAYRAALYFLTRTRDVAQAVDRLREVDHAVAAAVDRLGSSRPAADAGLSLFQLRIDIHEALAYAADAAASKMRSSTLLGLEKNPLLPQRVTRVVDDLTGLARHGSETPRLIRPAYASHPVTSEEPFTDDDYREAIGAKFHPRVLGVHDGQFLTLQGTSFEPLRTGKQGISFVMDRWGRMVGENEHAHIMHVLAAMGDEAAAWGVVFTDEDGRPVGQLHPYALGGLSDPMCTTQLRDVLMRAGFDLTDTSFNNESLGRLWQGELPSLPDLFTMRKWGLLNSIEAIFGVYDARFWVRTDSGKITQSPDQVRVPLTFGPLRRAPGHVDVVVYREGEHIIVQYRDGDPGAEPEQVSPVFRAFHERMTRWVSESDGVMFHPDTDAVVVTFVQPHDRPGNTQDRPDGTIGSRPPDSPADSNDSPRRTSAVFAPDTPASQVRTSLAESLASLEAGTTSVPTQLLDVAASLVNYGLAAAGGDSVEVSLSSRDDDNGITVVGTLLGSTVVRASRALESELLGKGFGTFEWRAGETESWSVHLWATRESIVHVDSAQLAGLATDFGADQVSSAISAAVGRASRRWRGLKYTGALAVEVRDGQLRVRMLGTVPLEGLAYEPPTLFDATITPPGPHRPGGFIGSRPPEAADAEGLFAELARNRAAAAAELRAAARQFGEKPPERGAEAAAIDAWQHAQKASAATIATLTGTNPSLVTTQISEVLNLLHRRLTALTRPEWDRLLSTPGQHLLTALGPWIGRSLRLEDDLQRATTLALEGTPDKALNTSNAERRTQRTRDLDDMLGRSATSAGAAANADLDLPQALERLAASTEETPTGHLLNALLDHLRFARLIQLTTTWMELDGYITKNFGRFETPEQSGDSAPKEGDRPSGLIGNRPQDQSTPWSRSSNRTGASDPADSTDRPEPSRTTPWSRPTASSQLDDLPDPTAPRFPHPNAWIAAARKRRKMSQKDLAAHIGLSVTQWGMKGRASDPRTKEFQVSLEHARRALEALAAPENVAAAFLQRFFPEAAAESGTDEPGAAHPPDFIGNRPSADETNLRTGLDTVAETPDVKQIQVMQGRPGVTMELLTFDDEDETQVLREVYDDVDQAMAEWTKAIIGRSMGAPIAEVRLVPPVYHVLFRDYVAEGAFDNPRAVDMLGLFAAITGKPSPFAAVFVRDVNGRRVWQDHHLPRQDIVEIGRLVKSVGDALARLAFPESISRTVLDTHMAAMSALHKVAQHAPEHPLWTAGLDDEAQAKTRSVANFELDHPYIELSGLISPHIPEKTVREVLGKLDDLLDRYRYAPGFRKLMTNIRVLKIDFLVGARATARGLWTKNVETGKLSPARTILTVSLQYASDREMALADGDRRRRYGLHPSSAQTYADDICHEFAHAIDQATHYALSDDLVTVLKDAHGMLQRYGLIESYGEWRSRLPVYAFEDSTKTSIAPREAIAVGFADAEINGIIVGTPQWVIHEYVTKLQPPEIRPLHVDAYQRHRSEV